MRYVVLIMAGLFALVLAGVCLQVVKDGQPVEVRPAIEFGSAQDSVESI